MISQIPVWVSPFFVVAFDFQALIDVGETLDLLAVCELSLEGNCGL